MKADCSNLYMVAVQFLRLMLAEEEVAVSAVVHVMSLSKLEEVELRELEWMVATIAIGKMCGCLFYFFQGYDATA